MVRLAAQECEHTHGVLWTATPESGVYHGSPIQPRNGFHMWLQTRRGHQFQPTLTQLGGASVAGELKCAGGPESLEAEVGVGRTRVQGGNIWRQKSTYYLPQLGVSLYRKEYKIMNLKSDMTIPKALESLRGEPHKSSSSWEAQDSGGLGGGAAKWKGSWQTRLCQTLWELLEALCLSHLVGEHISGILHFDQLQNSNEFVFGKICSCFSEESPWGWSYVVKHQCWPRFWKQSMKSQLSCQGYRWEWTPIVRGHQAPGETDPNLTSGSLIPSHPLLSISSPSPAQTCFYSTQ